jgi:hypothetical protein
VAETQKEREIGSSTMYIGHWVPLTSNIKGLLQFLHNYITITKKILGYYTIGMYAA